MRCPTFIFGLIMALVCSALASDNTHFKFADKLFQNVLRSDKSSSNLVFSPASLQTAMALLYLGADGETKQEMRTGLSLESFKDTAAVTYFFEDFVKDMTQRQQSNLVMANGIFASGPDTLDRKFKDIAENSFDSVIQMVDFSKKAVTVEKINAYVQDKTRNNVKRAASTEQLQYNTTMFLVNTLYFEADWVNRFHTAEEESFFVNKKKEILVPMMEKSMVVNWKDVPELKAEVLELPYKNTDLKMWILLPKDIEGLHEMEKNFAIDIVKSKPWKKELVSVQLPKFRFETQFGVKEMVENMGMKTLFTEKANFSPMWSRRNMYISDSVHNAFIQVNELGTKAAVAQMEVGDSLPDKYFNVDHPFMFMVCDDKAVYFQGHVVRI